MVLGYHEASWSRKVDVLYLYVILDVYSRYVVGWTVVIRESAELARRLIRHSYQTQKVQPGKLTLHADRGSSMASKPVAFLLADLGVVKSHSRTHVSNDNPFSESQFKTLKYRPDFPKKFGSLEEARKFCQGFLAWYNHEHRHVGVALLTPAVVHSGQASERIDQRAQVLAQAYQDHPERFVRNAPRPLPLPKVSYINKPVTENESQS